MSAPDKKIILRCFFQHKVIYLCAEFQLYLTPSTGFLPIDITFFGNIGLEYFSNQFLRVFHQSKLELSDLDEKLPKSRPLLLNIFESSNCVDRRIVHCVPEEWPWRVLLWRLNEAGARVALQMSHSNLANWSRVTGAAESMEHSMVPVNLQLFI